MIGHRSANFEEAFGNIYVDSGVVEYGLAVYGDARGSNGLWGGDTVKLAEITPSTLAQHGLSAGYLALHESAAWFDVSNRGRIRISGEDRARLLHAMSTNHVQGLEPGQGCYAFFLNAQGRILADVNILCFADHLLLETEPELRATVQEHLDRYVIADDVLLEDQTSAIAALVIAGPHAVDTLLKLGAPVPQQPWSHLVWDASEAGERVVVNMTTSVAGGYMLLVPAIEKTLLLAELTGANVPEASAEDARVVRLEAGRPRYGDEITDRNLVQETGLMQAVHSNKGCYLGQEIVERVRSRGQVHRRLRSLWIETDQPVAKGSPITGVDGTEAGELIESAYSPDFEKTIGTAYLRGPAGDAGAELRVAGIVATVRTDLVAA